MRNSERLLQICISLMAALSTLMLGLSQDDTSLALLALLAAMTSLLFTDVLGWFSLHRYVAGVLALIVGVYAMMRSQTGSLQVQFISVANLLIHLQLILLFQKKQPRIYWQLFTLSLLQVVVAAALNLFFLFGPLLVAYSAVALAALLVFFYHRTTKTTDTSAATGKVSPIQLQVSTARRTAGSPASPANWLKRCLVWNFCCLAASTVIVAAAVFLLMPRFGDGVWRAKATANKTGYSGEVDLSDPGSIYESPTVVMRVSFTDSVTGEPYLLSSEPYFRGSVLTDYNHGKWRRQRELNPRRLDPLEPPKKIYSAVRQTVIMDRQGSGTVFSLAPACQLEETPDSVLSEPRTHEVMYVSGENDDPAEYTIGTLALHNGLQSQYLPHREQRGEWNDHAMRQRRVRSDQPEIAQLADEIVANIPEDAILHRVRALEAHFTRGGYKYSLDPSPDRNYRRDAVVDFVTNHKTGHCQYFASALTLMLHSQGIPARVVVGYRAENFNVVGNYYQIREMDAHAWVEAAIPAERLPGDEVFPTEGLENQDESDATEPGAALEGRLGAWVRLDPTPSGDWVASAVAMSPWRQKISDSMDYMQLLWSEYVLGLNEKRQRKAIYEPIKRFFTNLGTLLFSRESWALRWEILRARFQGDFFTRQNGRDALFLMAGLLGLYYVARWAWGLLRPVLGRWWRQWRRASGARVEFYRQFERVLAKQGLRRRPNQTQQEFAELAATRLAAAGQANGVDGSQEPLAEIPGRLVELFYRVRYGADRLDTAEVERLENWLEQIKHTFAASRN